MKNKKDLKIFILEDATYRLQRFKGLFKDCKEIVTVASNVDTAIDILRKERFDILCLDHDLGLDKDNYPITAVRVADTIANENLQKEALIIIHSMNYVGVQRMKSSLKMAKVVSYDTLCNLTVDQILRFI